MEYSSEIHEIKDDNINRVPEAKITDNGNINKHIQNLSKEILSLSKKSNNNLEVGILASLHDSFRTGPIKGYWDEKYNTSRIDVYDNDEYLSAILNKGTNSLVFVHNHPNNSKVSYNDIMNLITDVPVYIVVAVSNNGDVSFVFKNHNEEKYYKHMYMRLQEKIRNVDREQILEYIDKLYENIMENPDRYGLTIGFSRRQ